MDLTPFLRSGQMLNGPIWPLRRADFVRIARMLHERRAMRTTVASATPKQTSDASSIGSSPVARRGADSG
jgi:hypothetical protein